MDKRKDIPVKINTYKHSFGFHHTAGLRVVYDQDGGINFYEPAPEQTSMTLEYDESKISIGPAYSIQIEGNVKDAAFGFALLMADNLGNDDHSDLIDSVFEFDKQIGIVKSLMETGTKITEFITAFNKVWPSVLVLGG
jgi:hypothetical protein